ncbi:MAG: DUF2807 domain-containing protein [Gammaproteobacteria bacterium]|nr:DUF2807 domain-containing protein [Gammaproteobacteria bacterium]
MKHTLRFAGVISLGIMMVGCDYNRPKLTSQFPIDQLYTLNQASGNYPLAPFDKLVLSGPIDVTLKSHQSENNVRASASPKVLNHLSVIPRKDELLITASGRQRINIEVDQAVTSTPLTIVVLKNVHLSSDNQDFLIEKIIATSNSQSHLYWLNTSHLNIIAKDKSKLFLAGVVTHLDITAMDSAEVNGKYLRADDSYVTALGRSDVGVNVKSALGTQSVGGATVYYYRDPEFGGVYLKDSGSALRMKGISGPTNNLLD